jgi:hypothetical protein
MVPFHATNLADELHWPQFSMKSAGNLANIDDESTGRRPDAASSVGESETVDARVPTGAGTPGVTAVVSPTIA